MAEKTPLERAAQAVAEGVAYRWEDGSWMVEGGRMNDANFTEIARAVLTAIREPSEVMSEAGGEFCENHNCHKDDMACDAHDCWQAMIDAALEEGVMDSPFQMTFKGFSLTPRMKEMGIVGLYRYDQHWRASFEKYDGAVFEMPLPVVQWLMEEGVDTC